MPGCVRYVRSGIAAIVTVLLFAGWVAASPDTWSLILSGQDVTRLAGFREKAGVLELNVSALALMVNLRIATARNSVAFTSASGKRWSATAGDFTLTGDAGRLQLPAPLRLEGTAVFLPLEALSRIAEVEVSVDKIAHIARINLQGASATGAGSANRRETGPPPAPVVNAPEGWEGFSTEKTDDEKRETARLEGRPESAEAKSARALANGVLREPDQAEALYITTENSYVYAHDGAMPVTGVGKLAGYDTDFSAFPTFGALGVRMLSGQFNFGDRGAGWKVSGGDLFSQIWGLARGVRYTDQITKKNLVSTSVYFQTQMNGPVKPVASLADQYDLNGHITLTGEVNSDSSYFAQGAIRASRFNGGVFYRDARMPNGNSDGFSAAYQLLRRVGVSAGYTSMGMGLDRIIMRNADVRWTIFRQVNLDAMETRTSTGYYKMRADSASLQLPMKRVRLNMRYQYRDIEYLASTLPPIAAHWTRDDQWTSDVSVRVNSRVDVNEQITTQWGPGTPPTVYDQFMATVIASRKLDFNVSTPLLGPMNSLRLLARAEYKFRPTTSFILEYGNISPYQTAPPVVNPQVPEAPVQQPQSPGFRISIRKTWRVDTPTRGGNIQGHVLDANQQPVDGAVVEAGPFATQTDENGAFSLRKLPRGEYTVKLRESSVPASLYGKADSIRFESEPGRVADLSFAMVNLREVHGWVFLDANGNGQPDAGEGIEMVTLKLGEEVSSSMVDGRFAFYNLQPGVYTVKIVSASLPKELVVASDEAVTVEIPATGEIPDILFRVEKKPEDIRFIEPLQNHITTTPATPATPANQTGSSQPAGPRKNP